MSATALELHEVLEEEFVRTGGEELPSPDDPITDADLLDRTKLSELFNINEKDVAKRLDELRKSVADSPGPLSIRDAELKLSDGTRRLAEGYAEADEKLRLRINRRILEDVCGDALRGAQAWPEITADQIIESGSCLLTLKGAGVGVIVHTPAAIAAAIETLRSCTNPADPRCPANVFAKSSRLTCDTALLAADYENGNDDDVRRRINRRILDDVFDGAMLRLRDVRLGRLYGELHKRPSHEARTAFCISGGGIRSATFALGVMQGLASHGLLKGFDFLSTVSGGGYIGSWLSSWTRRHSEGIAGVEKELAALHVPSCPHPAANPPQVKIEPEAKPIRHLREYSNYLTPRLGITSGDTWAFASLYLRNLVINLLILVPLLALLLAIPRLSAWVLKHIDVIPLWVTVALSDVSLLSLFWYIGTARPVRHGSEADSARWPISRLSQGARFSIFCAGGGLGASVGISMTWARWVWITSPPRHATPFALSTIRIGILAAAVAMTLIPCLTYFARYLRASYAARRESIATADDNGDGNRSIRNKRIIAETLAAIVATGGAAALYLFFTKVFDKPLDSLQNLRESPFYLAIETLASPRLLFICFGAPVVLFVLYLQATLFVAASSRYNEDYDREWWGRTGGWLLAGSVVWLVLSGVSIFGPLVIYRFPAIVGALGGASGLVAILLGRSPKSGSQSSESGSARSENALKIAVPLFCLFLLAAISSLTTLIIQKVESTEVKKPGVESQLESVVSVPEHPVGHRDFKETLRTKPIPQIPSGLREAHAHLQTIEKTKGREIGIIVLIAAFAFGASFAVGANRFSMHALYRARLIRAYLGASRYDRDPNPLTGFDPYDNVEMYKLRPELLWTSSFRNVDAFIEEMRKGISGTASRPLSNKLAGFLQDATRQILTDAPTLDAVIDQIGKALGKEDPATNDCARMAIANVKFCLPHATKRLAKNNLLDAALHGLAKKEAEKWKQDFDRGKNRVTIDTVVQDVNRILIEEELTGKREVPSSIDNRAAFDAAYAGWIVAMPRMRRGDPVTTNTPRIPARAPLHVVNTALNLVSGNNLAWQQRQAESFTISPLHSGSAFVGYRPSHRYGGPRGITLGTAVTISGAAASPNQGYHSSITLAFLLTMFNVRLGWWLGNPGAAGEDTYGHDNPTSTVNLLGREMVGETNDTYAWIYLSDGGHFENLGLYEMVLRRCRYIVVSDGGCDPKYTFEDLGNAIRKIRIDLGIPIEFESTPMRRRDEEGPWNYFATATIHYGAVDGKRAKDGTLLYLKPGYYPDEKLPRDVVNYAKECPDFPHETTADQWFSESQFESYRTLGRHAIDHITPPGITTVEQFVTTRR